MNGYREILAGFLLRLIPAGILAVAGWFLVMRAGGGFVLAAIQLLAGLACILVAAIIVAPPIARFLAEPAGNLFYKSEYFDRPQPMYGIPESKRKNGLYEEAIADLERIAGQYPDEVKAHVLLVDIAIVNLHDGDRANALYQRGIAMLKKGEDREILARMFAAIRTRLDTAPR